MREIFSFSTLKDEQELGIVVEAEVNTSQSRLDFQISGGFGDHEGSLRGDLDWATGTVAFGGRLEPVLPVRMHPVVASLVCCGGSSLAATLEACYREVAKKGQGLEELLHCSQTQGHQALKKTIQAVFG